MKLAGRVITSGETIQKRMIEVNGYRMIDKTEKIYRELLEERSGAPSAFSTRF